MTTVDAADRRMATTTTSSQCRPEEPQDGPKGTKDDLRSHFGSSHFGSSLKRGPGASNLGAAEGLARAS
eukprot:6606990-Pyramimonas_sp.AAC.1